MGSTVLLIPVFTATSSLTTLPESGWSAQAQPSALPATDQGPKNPPPAVNWVSGRLDKWNVKPHRVSRKHADWSTIALGPSVIHPVSEIASFSDLTIQGDAESTLSEYPIVPSVAMDGGESGSSGTSLSDRDADGEPDLEADSISKFIAHRDKGLDNRNTHR